MDSIFLKNILNLKNLKFDNSDEIFENIVNSPDIIVERIVSNGKINLNNRWYNQNNDELVILIQGEAELEFINNERLIFKTGDYFIIKQNIEHRVIKTSTEPLCIWLAIHYNFKK